MEESLRIELLAKLITDKNIPSQIKTRNKSFIYESIKNNETSINELTLDGWQIEKQYKTSVKLKKAKPLDHYFEDKVWTLFAKMGFNVMNKDRFFELPYDKNNSSHAQQINVFAKDKETIILVKCKTSLISNKKGDFRNELEDTSSQMHGLMSSIRALFPNERLKFKYIFATHNFLVTEQDNERLSNINAIHFDEKIIDYYFELLSQIGTAAKYQLLGSIFQGQEIPELDNKVPAVRGEMGGHTYYSFSIEPGKLLKIGYVLHRNKANINMMPTYQRLIKKNRLKDITNFIDDKKGYFPNSIVISIDAGKKDLQFDRANTQVLSTISDVGILHLPKKYRSAYIIDGQHRLYGYANSVYKDKNTVPVVAFVNLDRSEQVKIFMEINENQKSVSKNLRLTLNSDLLWTSELFTDQQKALFSRIAINLGENRNSVLYDKITIGEDTKIITSEAIVNALNKTSFFGKVSKNKIDNLGTFYKGNIDLAYESLSTFLLKSFDYIKENLDNEWEQVEPIFLMNKSVYAIIRVLSDICDFLIMKRSLTNPNLYYSEATHYLDAIILFYKNLNDEVKDDLRKTYGASGDIKFWRTLQKYIRDTYSDFNPTGLEDFIQKEKREYNEEAFKIIRGIEQFLNQDFKTKLKEKYGDGWFTKGIPLSIQKKTTELSIEKNYSKKEDEEDILPWECLHLIDYREIARKNWADLFEKHYTLSSEKKIPGGSDAKTKWLEKLNTLRNKNFHSYSVTKDEIEYLRDLNKHISSI
jgi:DNA sulfur modification protein DndB